MTSYRAMKCVEFLPKAEERVSLEARLNGETLSSEDFIQRVAEKVWLQMKAEFPDLTQDEFLQIHIEAEKYRKSQVDEKKPTSEESLNSTGDKLSALIWSAIAVVIFFFILLVFGGSY